MISTRHGCFADIICSFAVDIHINHKIHDWLKRNPFEYFLLTNALSGYKTPRMLVYIHGAVVFLFTFPGISKYENEGALHQKTLPCYDKYAINCCLVVNCTPGKGIQWHLNQLQQFS